MPGRNLTRAITHSLTRKPTDPGVGGGAFDPASLFGSEGGAILSFTSADSLATATNGTGTVTTASQIAYAADAGPLGRNATNATAAQRPLWLGIPRTLGSEVVTNGRFTADTDWTKGTGWTIAAGKASKSAGTAAPLSQAETLTAGQAYVIFYSVERTAGTVTPRFTGGTTVAAQARDATGSYYDVMVAATGNTTLEFSADASFAGAVKLVSIKPVTAFTNMGAAGDGSDDRLTTAAIDLSGTDKATVVFSMYQGQPAASKCVFEVGNVGAGTSGSIGAYHGVGLRTRMRGAATAVVDAPTGYAAPTYVSYAYVETVSYDMSQATPTTELTLRSAGVAVTGTDVGGGASAGAVNLANAALSVLYAPGFGQPANMILHRFFLIGRALTAGEKAQVEGWVKEGMAYCAVVGDSTVAKNDSVDGLSRALPVGSFVGGFVPGAAYVATAGDKIADQKTKWTAIADKSALEAVFVQVGLNDLNTYIGAGKTTAQIIADLQDLIDTINAAKPAGCKVYVSGVTPCRAWLEAGAPTPALMYPAWQAYNEAIAGSGATPITGVDGRITSHVAALDDGSGNLLAIYDHSADGVHESNEARFIIAQAWRAQLEADGLV